MQGVFAIVMQNVLSFDVLLSLLIGVVLGLVIGAIKLWLMQTVAEMAE